MDTSPKAQYENANRYDKISGFVLCFVVKVTLNSWIATQIFAKFARNDGLSCHLGFTRNQQTTLKHKFKSTQRHKLRDFEK